MMLEAHARVLGVPVDSAAAAWSYLRAAAGEGDEDEADEVGIVDGLISSYVLALEELREMPGEAAAWYMGEVRDLGLMAIEAVAELLDLALTLGLDSWARALATIQNALIQSLNRLAAGAAAAFEAFWGVPPIVGPMLAGGILLAGLAALFYISTGPVGLVLAGGAAKGLSKGVKLI